MTEKIIETALNMIFYHFIEKSTNQHFDWKFLFDQNLIIGTFQKNEE